MSPPAPPDLVFAPEGLLSKLPRVDSHMHTTFSDGRDGLPAMLEAAAERGLSQVAVTDHVRRTTDWFPRYVQEIRRQARRFPQLQVWVGLEAKALDFQGTLDATPEMLEQADFVLGAVHRYPDGRGGLVDVGEVPPEQAQRLELDAALGLLRNPRVSSLAHPGATYGRRHGPLPDRVRRELFDGARRHGKPLELSARYEPDPDAALALHTEYGVSLTLGSDAHSTSEVGQVVAALERLAARC